VNHFLQDIFFADNDTGYIAGTSGLLYKITTGGSITGISDPEPMKSQIKIFPNPSEGIFTITSQKTRGDQEITVRDITGKVVLHTHKSFSSAQIELNLTGCPPGIYFIRLSDDKAINNLKVVITENR
jgi:hypothetical protein